MRFENSTGLLTITGSTPTIRRKCREWDRWRSCGYCALEQSGAASLARQKHTRASRNGGCHDIHCINRHTALIERNSVMIKIGVFLLSVLASAAVCAAEITVLSGGAI